MANDKKFSYTLKQLYEQFSRIFVVNEYKGGWSDPLDYYIFEAHKRSDLCPNCEKFRRWAEDFPLPDIRRQLLEKLDEIENDIIFPPRECQCFGCINRGKFKYCENADIQGCAYFESILSKEKTNEKRI